MEHPVCAYIGLSACQALLGVKVVVPPDSTGKCDIQRLAGDASLTAVLLHCERLRIMV